MAVQAEVTTFTKAVPAVPVVAAARELTRQLSRHLSGSAAAITATASAIPTVLARQLSGGRAAPSETADVSADSLLEGHAP